MIRLVFSLSILALVAAVDGWTTPINLSQSLLRSDNASLALDSQGSPMVAWSEDTGTQYDIFFTIRQVAGWTPPVAIAETSGYSDSPSLATGQGGTIHAVWDDSSPGLNSLTYSVWDGASWTSPAGILPDPRPINCPQIAVDSTGSPHVVWQDWDDGQIYHSVKSTAGWSQPQIISLGLPEYAGFLPQLAADEQGKVYVVWYGTDGGAMEVSFSACAVEVCTPATAIPTVYGSSPAITVDGLGRPHVLFGSGGSVFYIRSDDGGASWSAPEPLPELPGIPLSMVLHTDSFNRPHVAWTEEMGVGDAQVAYVAWLGASWSEPVRLSIGPEGWIGQSLAIDGQNQVHVAWTEWATDTGEILYTARSGVYPRIYLPVVLYQAGDLSNGRVP